MTDRDSHLLRRIAQIHTASPRIVYAFAGAGSLALWQLHRVAGSSHTILEAIDCYAPRALAMLLGYPPAQAASQATAQAMAEQAYRRAQLLVERAEWPLLGVGCAAALATDRERRGADRCALAIYGADKTYGYTLIVSKGREREAQEVLVTQLIIGALAVACHLCETVPLDLLADEHLEHTAA